jgi:hypothetical protein
MSAFEDKIKQEAGSALGNEEQELNQKLGTGQQDDLSAPQSTAGAQPQQQADAPTPDTNS